ncbi:MAG: hypothetical protein ACO1SX_13885 [Actinomycetota bacterium]
MNSLFGTMHRWEFHLRRMFLTPSRVTVAELVRAREARQEALALVCVAMERDGRPGTIRYQYGKDISRWPQVFREQTEALRRRLPQEPATEAERQIVRDVDYILWLERPFLEPRGLRQPRPV